MNEVILQKDEIKYLKTRLQIQDFFKHESDEKVWKKVFNKLLLTFHPDKRQQKGIDPIADKIYQYLQGNKHKFIDIPTTIQVVKGTGSNTM